ncbi:cell wall protein RBR3-like isoform X13 [Polyodon spathula]|uniref:cell wall protein RBR3-like isoform X13 n=1 Tax=Polyodon spathula TaxID=7913 RepID=UPI001B7DC878|nr:cell wall protein RBR3-like isoform X13 [Polyodon spathula]
MKKAKDMPEGERTIVLRQMKVRTALKGDFSWINNKNTDEEDEEEEGLAKDVPVKSSHSNGVSSAPSDSSSTSESSPASQKPSPSGYIIRGVFTKTNDTTQAFPTSTSSYGESVRSSNTSTPQYSPLNKRSAEHYKQIAPHSVRSKAVSPAPEEPPSSTEEHTKRTEAANSVIKSSAPKERSYVLSAVNKYSSPEKLDIPSKDTSFSFVAKRVEISDEEPEENCDTSPRIAPKISLNQKPTAAPRKLSPNTETKTQTTVMKKETVFDIPKNTFSTESKSPSTERKTQNTVTKETVFDTPKNLISAESKTKSSQDTKSLWDKWDKPAATETAITTVTQKSSLDTKSAWDKWDVPTATEITTTTVTQKSSQDTKSQWDKWDLPAATETTTTTVTEKSSQDTKSLWDKWDKPAATETAITTVTEKSSLDTKSAWDKWDVPTATEITTTTVTQKSSQDAKSQWDKWDLPAATETTTTVTEKSSQDIKSLWDKWDKPGATETAITTVTEKSSLDTKSAWDKWDVPTATEITTTTVTQKREADTVIPTWRVMDITKNMSVSTQQQSPSIQTQTTFTKKETVFETEPVTESAFTIAKETKQDPPTASDLISFDMEENNSVTTIHTTKYQTEDPVQKTFDSSDLTNIINTDTTTHQSKSPDPEYKKIVMVKEYVNSTGFNPSEYSSINKYDNITYSHSNYSYSSPSATYRSSGTSCSYCGEMVGDDARITIEHLNIYSHPSCFKCGVCSKPMGELLESMYIHGGQVHCDSCYDQVF